MTSAERTVATILLLIITTSIIGQPQQPATDDVGAETRTADNPPATPEGVRSALDQLEMRLAARKGSLPKIPIFSQGTCSVGPVYMQSFVQQAYAQSRSEFFATLSAPEATPLRSLLEPDFPKTPTKFLAGNQSLDEGEVNALFEALRQFLGRAKDLARPMTVMVSTNGPKALSKIRPSAGGAGPAAQFTRSTYDELFRGFYHLTVLPQENRHKPFDKEIGKLADDVVTIECHLVSVASTSESICAVAR